MNPDLKAELIDANRQLLGETGEIITLAGVEYSCTAAEMSKGDFEWVQGGVLDMYNISVCVLQDDLADAPVLDTLAIFRGDSYRVKSVGASETQWQLFLVQQFA